MSAKKSNDQQQAIDAVVHLVLEGYDDLFDAEDLYFHFHDQFQPNCCSNYEYVLARNHDCDPSSININWSKLNKQVLRLAVKNPNRIASIESGESLTSKEKQAYRLALARKKYGYQTAKERLKAGIDIEWADLQYLEDIKRRRIYVLLIGIADTTTDAQFDAMSGRELASWHQSVWNWKSKGFSLEGPFLSEEEAEGWMTAIGAFCEPD